MFSSTAVIELLKALAKFLLILFDRVDRVEVRHRRPAAHRPYDHWSRRLSTVCNWWAGARCGWPAGLILIAAVDVPVQLYQSHKKLLMTKQEIRDEHKDHLRGVSAGYAVRCRADHAWPKTTVTILMPCVRIRPDTRIVWIANPNNPTGNFLPYAEVRAFLASVPKDVVVVLDEAYNEYIPAAERRQRPGSARIFRICSSLHLLQDLRPGRLVRWLRLASP